MTEHPDSHPVRPATGWRKTGLMIGQREGLDFGRIGIIPVPEQGLPERSIERVAGWDIAHVQQEKGGDEADRSPSQRAIRGSSYVDGHLRDCS